jgi:hypothetical protein
MGDFLALIASAMFDPDSVRAKAHMFARIRSAMPYEM